MSHQDPRSGRCEDDGGELLDPIELIEAIAPATAKVQIVRAREALKPSGRGKPRPRGKGEHL